MGVHLDEHQPVPSHTHQLRRDPGGITCTCGLDVRRPPAMPDYSRATMAAWALRESR